jgi:hypothetical protein
MPFPWFGKRKDKPPTDSRSKKDFQEPMLRYAEQRLIAWLISKGGNDLASQVSSYVIEEGRVCAEILPYRIYVYDLDNFLGQFGYEALERRHDAPGDVFEHKKTELAGVYKISGDFGASHSWGRLCT